jgi:hypothetical protein
MLPDKKGGRGVRLDEWQKYIEAQFLDEAEPAAGSTPPQPASHADAVPTPLPLSLDEPQIHSAPVPNLPPHDAEIDVEADAEVSDFSLDADAMPPIEQVAKVESALDAPSPYLQIDTSSMSSASEDTGHTEVGAGNRAVANFDIDIPEFDAYLPPSHRAARSERPQGTDKAPLPRPATESEPHLFVKPMPPVSKPTDDKVPQQTDPRPPGHANLDRHTDQENGSQNIRRAPRSRARHARNVRPDSVPSGLSAGELWATVPKHVQALLALERLEEEQEVAQFSYKRPFQEKRHELIERLLDPILSLEDAARLLNVCPTTVRRYTNKGILTYYRKEPERAALSDVEATPEVEETLSQSQGKETRQRRFRLSDILAFLETQQAALEADRAAEETGVGPVRKRRSTPVQRTDRTEPGLP